MKGGEVEILTSTSSASVSKHFGILQERAYNKTAIDTMGFASFWI